MSDRGFVSLNALKGEAPRDPAEVIAEIRRIYFATTKQTIEHDLAHAIELLKSLPDEETRDRAAVYMEGLAEMRKEWARREKGPRRASTPPAGSRGRERRKPAGKGPKPKIGE